MPWQRQIQSPADVKAALNRVAHTRGNLALAADPISTAAETAPSSDITQALPCDPQLAPLLPWSGLRRGATISTVGSTSLLMLLLAGAMRDTGSWAAIVGMPQLGVLAAGQDHGIPLERLALVPEPGPDWPTVVAALLDGVDLVVVNPPPSTDPRIVGNLAARARQKGAVLIPTTPWPGADVALVVTGRRWRGLGEGRGRLRWCELDVQAAGRGRAARPKKATVVVPGRPSKQVIPPMPARPEPGGVDNPLWAQLRPSPPPADPWAELTKASG